VSPNRLRLGAVSYLNARPLVYGLERKPRFDLRYDVPSECARLLHGGSIDVGLIPSIEYLRGRAVRIVPGPRRPRAARSRRSRSTRDASRATSDRSRWTPARGRRWRSRRAAARGFGVAPSGADGAGSRAMLARATRR
jgi:hypothetical protein